MVRVEAHKTIRVANGGVLKCPTVGSIKVQQVNDSSDHYKPITLTNVMQHSNLSSNLLSVPKFLEEDKTRKFTFENECAKITGKNGEAILTAPKKDGLYIIQLQQVE